MEEPRESDAKPEEKKSPPQPQAKEAVAESRKKEKKAPAKKGRRSPWWVRGGGWRNLPQWGRVLIIVGVVGVGLAVGFAVRTHLPGPSLVTYRLVVTASPEGTGKVKVNPVYQSYREDSPVTITAVPAPGYEFNSWSGDASGSDPILNLTMDSDKDIVAVFGLARHILTTQVNPPGAGTVTPAGGDFETGSSVTLAAVAATGYEFTAWSGDAFGSEPTITVTMDSDRAVNANFQPRRYSLSVIANPVEGGSISPASGLYDYGSEVTLTATPEEGYEFGGWSGDVFSNSPTVTVTMDANKEAVALFVPTFQHIDMVMPKGISGSITVFSNTLSAGEMIQGYVELTGEFVTQDRSFDWSVEVFAPEGRRLDFFRGHWVKKNHCDLNLRAPFNGEYRIIVRHNSLYDKDLTIRIQPEGWVEE